jgi:hypothetical protein
MKTLRKIKGQERKDGRWGHKNGDTTKENKGKRVERNVLFFWKGGKTKYKEIQKQGRMKRELKGKRKRIAVFKGL